MLHRAKQSQESLPFDRYDSPTSNTRRGTQASLYPPSPDENVQRSRKRSGSPLRHSISASPQSVDGSPLPGGDGDPWGNGYSRYNEEPTSPTLGTTFARVANSIVSSLRSPSLHPSEDEIEAQAIREREHSRHEAERILMREAEERRIMEEKILAMRGVRSESQTSLNLPPSLAPSAPGGSPRKEESGWWQSAKSKLAPAKELTAAQQIIKDTKVKDKEAKKGKGREPRTPTRKSSDPSLHLDLPHGGMYRPESTSPTQDQHTPSKEYPGSFRPGASPAFGMSPASKSGKEGEGPPVYAKFTYNGTLDVAETLLTIARRFEKLERWTVGHVRALEDRVGDVEKWLVDKEDARQASDEARQKELGENKKLVQEIKTRGDELKRIADESQRNTQQLTKTVQQTVEREVAKAVAKIPTPSTTFSSSREPEVTKRDLQQLQSEISTVRDGVAEITSKLADMSRTVPGQHRASDRRNSGSPVPVATHNTGGVGSTSSRSRLPYPSGDYASGDGITPPSSPPPILPVTNGRFSASTTSPSVPTPTPVTPGLRSAGSFTSLNAAGSFTSLNATRPLVQSTNSYSSLDIPAKRAERPSSTSPTPRNRKRYTVALGGSLASPLEQLQQDFEEANKDAEPDAPSHDDSPMGIKLIGSSAFSRDSPSPSRNGHGKEETIGGTPIDLSRVAVVSPPSGNTPLGSLNSSRLRNQNGSPGSLRIRAQSAYGAPAGWDSMSQKIGTTPPLRPRRRSGDMSGQAEFGAMSGPKSAGGLGSTNKFVDPLILRKKDKEVVVPRLPVPKGKTSFGDLLAFFDGEKKGE
ncbi:hypothetical protein M408DRAFT_331494 [Serendipita vermifera MAFF 305830]|uniref:Uncharacterized protein n=1 Tax=Serendipita vermifera MAFF 305830 TaxID=933852 RepID=A0A0C3AKE0_SERVB|nr:hypothetical protein M408DRAFT_331494 [Serendipita vermifera MAFF 305830]